MLDVKNEKPLRLADARLLKLFASPPSFTTLVRWCTHGIDGIVLEHARQGRTLVTSEAAVVRFMERLTDRTPQDKPTKSDAERSRKRAASNLDALGIK